MYGFGNIPSQLRPIDPTELALPSGKRVYNDIRDVYDKIYANQDASSFGYGHYNSFGYDDEDTDSEDDDDLEFGRYTNSFGYDTDTDTDDDLEFGKKRRTTAVKRNQSNAKKAMKLAHSRGITLKQAWAIVKKQSGGTSRKTTTKRSKKTTKRSKTTKSRKSTTKGRSQAKRAMKLAHREGISLKAAWKRIKKN